MAAAYRTDSLVLGLALTGLGVVWMLGNLGMIDALFVLRRWWPLALVVWGVLEIAAGGSHAGKAARRSGA